MRIGGIAPNRSSDRDFSLNLLDFCVHFGMRTLGTTLPGTGAERFLDDRLDGPGTSSAFRTASEASINLLGRTRQVICCGHGRADVVIGQYVTGTNDHENGTRLRYAITGGYC